jgi:hypothetical protein
LVFSTLAAFAGRLLTGNRSTRNSLDGSRR